MDALMVVFALLQMFLQIPGINESVALEVIYGTFTGSFPPFANFYTMLTLGELEQETSTEMEISAPGFVKQSPSDLRILPTTMPIGLLQSFSVSDPTVIPDLVAIALVNQGFLPGQNCASYSLPSVTTVFISGKIEEITRGNTTSNSQSVTTPSLQPSVLIRALTNNLSAASYEALNRPLVFIIMQSLPLASSIRSFDIHVKPTFGTDMFFTIGELISLASMLAIAVMAITIRLPLLRSFEDTGALRFIREIRRLFGYLDEGFMIFCFYNSPFVGHRLGRDPFSYSMTLQREPLLNHSFESSTPISVRPDDIAFSGISPISYENKVTIALSVSNEGIGSLLNASCTCMTSLHTSNVGFARTILSPVTSVTFEQRNDNDSTPFMRSSHSGSLITVQGVSDTAQDLTFLSFQVTPSNSVSILFKSGDNDTSYPSASDSKLSDIARFMGVTAPASSSAASTIFSDSSLNFILADSDENGDKRLSSSLLSFSNFVAQSVARGKCESIVNVPFPETNTPFEPVSVLSLKPFSLPSFHLDRALGEKTVLEHRITPPDYPSVYALPLRILPSQFLDSAIYSNGSLKTDSTLASHRGSPPRLSPDFRLHTTNSSTSDKVGPSLDHFNSSVSSKHLIKLPSSPVTQPSKMIRASTIVNRSNSDDLSIERPRQSPTRSPRSVKLEFSRSYTPPSSPMTTLSSLTTPINMILPQPSPQMCTSSEPSIPLPVVPSSSDVFAIKVDKINFHPTQCRTRPTQSRSQLQVLHRLAKDLPLPSSSSSVMSLTSTPTPMDMDSLSRLQLKKRIKLSPMSMPMTRRNANAADTCSSVQATILY
ncbi:hypothetical protein EW145_g6113 [Phellinidium pouzarii]|uniref:Uncharacterized protein n=1 Tax=Phellinidium pouzarii TaxID=167371 RepID=A0A4V6S140_9AGAM|nr:hypothetical protein EW145_g6113 [Phellinidium pouzarii]